MRQLNFLLTLSTFLILAFQNASPLKVKSARGLPLPVDSLRLELLQMFNNRTIVNDMDLILAFRDFGDNMETIFPRGKRLLPPQMLLKNNQAWSQVLAEMLGINGLYDSFRRYQTSPGKLAGEDLTRTILDAKEHSIPDACENIFKLTVMDNNLFLEALKV